MRVRLRFDGGAQADDWDIEVANAPHKGQLLEFGPRRVFEVLEVLDIEGESSATVRAREVVE